MEQIGIRKKQGSIVEVIRDAILSGSIPADTEMTQKELAEDLGVSRMPVREALILLEYQGLVRRLPNNHVRAAEFSEGYFEQLFRLCAGLEMDVLHGRDSAEGLPDGEMEFHRLLCREHPYELQKKMLETMTEIYISYATGCASYDRELGKSYICRIREAAMKGEWEEMTHIYQEYFADMKDSILKERGADKC